MNRGICTWGNKTAPGDGVYVRVVGSRRGLCDGYHVAAIPAP